MPGPNSVIVRPASTNSCGARTVNRGFRSTPRIASTAKRTTSRTRPRTSTGSHPKAVEAPITRTCKWLTGAALAGLVLVPASANARIAAAATAADPAQTYLAARAAAMNGDHARSAALLAALAESQPAQPDLARKALAEALGAGQMDLALTLIQKVPTTKLPNEARLLLTADALRHNRIDRAQGWLAIKAENGDLGFLTPLLTAWGAAQRSEAVTAFSSDLARLQRTAPPIALVQVARYANPRNSSATLLLALILASQQRASEALAAVHSIPRDDALTAQTRDVEVKILSENKRFNEAYALAAAAAAAPGAGVSDFSRLGDVLQALKRYNDAANAYTRAVALAHAQGLKADLWPLLLLQANALEQANRWPEAKQALQEALTIAPEQPVLLNFLGYAKLNLALHVRGKLPDGRHSIETVFAFCTDGDRLSAEAADALTLKVTGPFAAELDNLDENLVVRAARALREAAGVSAGAAIALDKQLPVAS